jgi:hexosaminidase
MKLILLVLFLVAGEIMIAQPSQNLPLIPKPASVIWGKGTFSITARTIIIATKKEFISDAEAFNDLLERTAGFRFQASKVRVSELPFLNVRNAIVLKEDVSLSDEAYTLLIDKDQITIAGNGAGVWYGLLTVLQMIPPGSKLPINIPFGEIQDSPRYQWRGMHLDVCRHFFPVDFIKRYIDYLSMYKMNIFHWHLTEDQGWRIEIKKYPRLTEIGAWRDGSMIGPYSAQQFDSVRYGGYYTQDQVRDIVAYAAKRHVTVVPEIEMPGHSTAALAAYPWLSCTGGPFEVGKAWGVYEDVYCAKDSTFDFLEDVLEEVLPLFPGKYIHIGGDESPKTRWKECPQCQAVIQKEGLKDEHELQSYFIEKIEKFVNSKGKQIIGWDEILEGGLAPNAAVMSWRGTEGGIAAAKQKHQAVMTPGSHCYFDYYQGTPAYEPLAIGGYTTVEKVYSYEPTPEELSQEERNYILGAQGNVWTEYMTSAQQVEYMALPRMAALAEVVWSPKEQRDYEDFRPRLLNHFKVLDRLGVNYSKAIYEVKLIVQPAMSGDGLTVGLSSAFDSTGLRYTLDGSVPTVTSPQYEAPIPLTRTSTLKAAYFGAGTMAGRVISQEFTFSKSTGKKISLTTSPDQRYPGSGAFTLVDGMRGDTTRFGQNWLGWQGPDMEGVIDLGKEEQISKIRLGIVNAEASWIHPPKSVSVLISSDGAKFSQVKELSSEEILRQGQSLTIPLGSQTTRYVKVIVRNAGKIPEGKPGAGRNAWVFVDEIVVE